MSTEILLDWIQELRLIKKRLPKISRRSTRHTTLYKPLPPKFYLKTIIYFPYIETFLTSVFLYVFFYFQGVPKEKRFLIMIWHSPDTPRLCNRQNTRHGHSFSRTVYLPWVIYQHPTGLLIKHAKEVWKKDIYIHTYDTLLLMKI